MPGAAPFSNIAPFTNTPAPGPFNNVGMDQQSLLRWGIEHSAPGALRASAEAIQAGKRSDLNTDVLKAIMGTSDADRMTECVMVTQGKWVDREPNGKKPEGWKPLTDADVTKEDRIRAWDDLEMLIEDLDNANDLKFLKLWEPIFKSCSDEDDDVAMRACWVCGTAVQNNPKAQDAFLELDPLPTMCSIIMSTDVSASVRSKAMYCLSSTLKHSEAAVTRFTEIGGWKVLNQSLQDSSLTVRTKTAFLLSQLVSQSTAPSALLTSLRSSSILSSLISSLLPSSSMPTGPSGDIEAIDLDYREKSLRVIVNVVEAAGTELLAEEKSQIKSVVENVESESDWETQVEEMGLAKEEWESFRSKIGSTE